MSTSVTASLADIRPGMTATIQSIEGQDTIASRLLEMGLIPGTQITLVGVAPLGDPLEYQVRGYHLSLRKLEAQRVKIGDL